MVLLEELWDRRRCCEQRDPPLLEIVEDFEEPGVCSREIIRCLPMR